MSLQRLIELIDKKRNPTVAGLDPLPEYVPGHIRKQNYDAFGPTLEAEIESIRVFNHALIDALEDIVPAVKPQSAFYERLGPKGALLLSDTVDYAKKKGMYVILDAKRGDIGSTAKAYAQAYLGEIEVEGRVYEPYPCDCLTVNAYLGSDGIDPFIDLCRERDKAVFVLVKTSNPSSGEFQDRLIDGEPLYIQVARKVAEWGDRSTERTHGYTNVGAVVGATYPKEQKILRTLLPRTMFLVPGYGAQGATADQIVSAFDRDGKGAIVNSSRGILCAWKKAGSDGRDFAECARKEALRMQADLNRALETRKGEDI